MTTETNQKEAVARLQSEIDKMNLLISKMNESLQNPFLNSNLRLKYKAAVKECEKRIKILRGDIRAIEIMNTIDVNNIELPKHYQHHPK